MYITILLAGIGIFLLFRGLTFVSKAIPLPKIIKQYLGYILPVAEFAFWLGYFIWAVRTLYAAYNTLALIIIGVLLVLIVAPVWFLFRDFIYGLILKLQRKIETGIAIEIEDIHGTVINTGLLSFEIKSGGGNIESIPYNKIIGKVIVRHGTNTSLNSHLIRLCVDSSNDIRQLLPKLKNTLINAPWMVGSEIPIIKKVEKENNEYLIDVVVYTVDEDHVEKIKDYVERRMDLCR